MPAHQRADPPEPQLPEEGQGMTVSDTLHTAAQQQVRSIIERIENLEEQKKAISDDIREVYAEAKSNGHCVKTLRKIVALRKKDESQRLEEEALVATYMHALGMLPQLADLPLGKAAIAATGHEPSEGPHSPEASVASQGKADMDRAYQRGCDAAEDGQKRFENPYLHEDPRHGVWDDGFAGRARQDAREMEAA
jgi:uncharacterized protein (UPF0335 family)